VIVNCRGEEVMEQDVRVAGDTAGIEIGHFVIIK
jgi:hypothetical protein